MKAEEHDVKKSLFVPATFEVPSILETERSRLRMLSVSDAGKDFEAVIESRADTITPSSRQ
jgi:hypothetical protein